MPKWVSSHSPSSRQTNNQSHASCFSESFFKIAPLRIFRHDEFPSVDLYISITVPLLCSAIFNIIYFFHLSVPYPRAPPLLSLISVFAFSHFLGSDSPGSIGLPERVHQMPRHRLQLESVSKHSGDVGGFNLIQSFLFTLRASCFMRKLHQDLILYFFHKSFPLM